MAHKTLHGDKVGRRVRDKHTAKILIQKEQSP